MIRVTRRYHFAASHRLHAPDLTEEENQRIYGKCNNPYGHGHNYVLDVSVRGPIDGATGRAVDLEALDRLVNEEVIRVYDHHNLNAELPEFSTLVPTTENVALEIDRRLHRSWSRYLPDSAAFLEKIRIAETERNIFEVHESLESSPSEN
ncbi:MAG: 6-carboxytetrahydropterin synthase [Bryobacteraceae bacterium]